MLAATFAVASPALRAALAQAAYMIAWPVVFHQKTQRLERARGHVMCATSALRLGDGCLDKFHDDVEAVVDDILTYTRMPIGSIEAWITPRLNPVTIDAHRRRRGRIGALQRPRPPKWLARALDDDPWLVALAVHVLEWVGVDATAGHNTWPLDSWARDRAAHTGDDTGSTPGVIARELDRVLAAMRTRERWFSDHVERPLGRKRPPVVGVPGTASPSSVQWDPLSLVSCDEQDDMRLADLASVSLSAIGSRLRCGEEAGIAVTEVLQIAFGCTVGRETSRPPHAGSDLEAFVQALLSDEVRVRKLIREILDILNSLDETPAPAA